jgi:hypothetical protein
MGICSGSKNKKQRIVMNKNGSIDSGHNEIILKFQKEIKMNPFFNLNSTNIQEKLINQFENSNSSPNIFISSQNKYSNAFKKQFTFSFLKSEPLLNNIFPSNEKVTGRLFIKIVLLMLTNGSPLERKLDLANQLVLEAFDHSQKKFNIGKMREIIRNIISIGIIVVIYFGGLFIFLNEEIKTKIFENDENFQVEGKYDISSLDTYFFNKFLSVRKDMNEDFFISIWEEFLLLPLFPENDNKDKNIQRNTQINYDNLFMILNEEVKEDIKHRLCNMFDSFVFFEVFLTGQVAPVTKYNNKIL